MGNVNVDRVESLANIQNLEKEFDVILGGLGQIQDSIVELNKYEILGKGKVITVKEVSDATDKLNKVLKENADLNKKLAAAQSQQEVTRKRLAKSIQDEEKANRNNNKALDETVKQKQKIKQAETFEAQTKAFYNKQLADSNRNLRLNAALENAVSNSIDEARAKISLLTVARDSENVATKKGIENIQKYNSQINVLNQFIDQHSDRLTNQKRNIGNYESALRSLGTSIRGFGGLGQILSRALGISPETGLIIHEAGQAIIDLKHGLDIKKVAEKENAAATAASTTAQAVNTEVVKKASFFQKIYKLAVGESTGAMKIFRLTLLGLGIGAVAFGLFGLISSFRSVKDETAKAKEELKDYLKSASEIRGAASAGEAGEIAKIRALAAVVQDQTKSYNERNNALKQLKEINENYFGDLTLESEKIKTLTSRVNELAEALIAEAIVKEFSSEIAKTTVQLAKETDQLDKLKTKQLETNKALEEYNKRNDIAAKRRQGAVTQLDVNDQSKLEFAISNSNVAVEKQNIKIKLLSDQLGLYNDQIRKAVELALKLKPLKAPPKGDKETFDDSGLSKLRDAQLEIFRTEEIAIQFRLNARRKAYDLDKQLIIKKAAFDIQQAEGNAAKIKSILSNERAEEELSKQKRDSDILKLTTQFYNKLVSITREGEKLALEMRKEIRETDDAHRKSEQEVALQDTQNYYDQQLVDLDANYAKQREKDKSNKEKLIKDENEYNKRKLILQYQLQKKLLLQDIEFAEAELTVAKLRAEQEKNPQERQRQLDAIAVAEQKLSAIRIRLNKNEVDFKIKSNELQKDSDKKLFDNLIKGLSLVKDYAAETANIIGGIIDGVVERQKNSIQDQIDLLDKQKEKDIEVANQTIANANLRADTITAIEARANAQKEALQRKQRQADENKARFDKAANIANIITGTALAVVNTLKDPTLIASGRNIIEAIIVGAIGAAKLAVAIATPIPHYKEGIYDEDSHPGGAAIVGDGNIAEAIVTPDGKLHKSPSRSTLVNLPKGTQVYPDFNRFAFTSIPEYRVQTLSDGSTAAAVQHMENKVVNAIEKIPQPIIKTDGNWRRYLKTGHSVKHWIGNGF